MKLHQEKEEIYGNANLENATAFGMKSSPEAFMILSKNLYSYCERAIIRELATNATDSHKEAGTLNTPFKIQLPTNTDLRFICRDYGTGLSPENIKLMLTYFESSKVQTNDYIGAFGLGAKSPFSYTDTFNIVSYFNGVAYGFTAFLHEGMPKCLQTFEKPTDEHNGVEITIPVKANDVYSWRSEARYVLRHFTNHKPNVNIDIEYMPDFDDYLLNVSGKQNGVFAVMGRIEYKIPREFYANTWFDTVKNLFIKFDIGKLDIMPSRESLHFSQKTKETLKNKIQELHNIFVEKECLKIKNKKTEREVAIHENMLTKDHSRIIQNLGTIGKWDVPAIVHKFHHTIKKNEPSVGGFVYISENNFSRPKTLKNSYMMSVYRLWNHINLHVDNFVCFVDDIGKTKPRTEFLYGIQEMPEHKGIKKIFMFKKDSERDMKTLEHIKEYFDESEIRVYMLSECDHIRKLARSSIKQNVVCTKERKKPQRKENCRRYTLKNGEWVCEVDWKSAKEIRELDGVYVVDSQYRDRFKLQKVLEFIKITDYYTLTEQAQKYVVETKLKNALPIINKTLGKIAKTISPNKLCGEIENIATFENFGAFRYYGLDDPTLCKNLPKTMKKIKGSLVDENLSKILKYASRFVEKETKDIISSKFELANKRINESMKKFKENNPCLFVILAESIRSLYNEKTAENFEKLVK